eukprot:SAG31_NODE_13102_length_892_cov_1.406053_1_plen_105_part_01
MTKFGQKLKAAAHQPWAAKYLRYKVPCAAAAAADTFSIFPDVALPAESPVYAPRTPGLIRESSTPQALKKVIKCIVAAAKAPDASGRPGAGIPFAAVAPVRSVAF